MEEELNSIKPENNQNIKIIDNLSIKSSKNECYENLINENKIGKSKMEKIIQIKNKEGQNILPIKNNQINSNTLIKINFNNNNKINSNNNINNKIYKKNHPKIKEYFNNDNNNYNYNIGICSNFLSPYEQLFLNQINFNRRMRQLNYINYNENLLGKNIPSIITNNKNYYYSILDDFPIHMPLYIDNAQSRISMKIKQIQFQIIIIV